jgi:hypothetical protein
MSSVEWSAARKACRNVQELADLEEAIRLGWRPDELAEFVRTHQHTSAYRLAIKFIQTDFGSSFLKDPPRWWKVACSNRYELTET